MQGHRLRALDYLHLSLMAECGKVGPHTNVDARQLPVSLGGGDKTDDTLIASEVNHETIRHIAASTYVRIVVV